MLTREQIEAKSGRRIEEVYIKTEKDCVYVRSLIVEDFLELSTIQKEQGEQAYTNKIVQLSLCDKQGVLFYDEPVDTSQWPASLFMPIIEKINEMNGLNIEEPEKNSD